MSLLLGGGAYTQDKNTSARICVKNAEGAYARRGAYFSGHYGILYYVDPLIRILGCNNISKYIRPYLPLQGTNVATA